MDIEEKKAKLNFLQKFFAMNFWISFILLFIATAACILMRDLQLAFVQKYFPISVESYNALVILILGIWKVIIFQFTLIPAVVIWGIRKCCLCKIDE